MLSLISIILSIGLLLILGTVILKIIILYTKWSDLSEEKKAESQITTQIRYFKRKYEECKKHKQDLTQIEKEEKRKKFVNLVKALIKDEKRKKIEENTILELSQGF